jgi:hypothetical protein
VGAVTSPGAGVEESARHLAACFQWHSSLWAGGARPAAPDAATAQALDYLLADDQDHLECLTDWSDRLADGRRPGGAPQPSR